MVASARRSRINASDAGMKDIELRDLVSILQNHPKIVTLLLTGGNSKNGPEYLLRRHLKSHGIKLKNISDSVHRIHTFLLPINARIINTVILHDLSVSSNHAV